MRVTVRRGPWCPAASQLFSPSCWTNKWGCTIGLHSFLPPTRDLTRRSQRPRYRCSHSTDGNTRLRELKAVAVPLHETGLGGQTQVSGSQAPGSFKGGRVNEGRRRGDSGAGRRTQLRWCGRSRVKCHQSSWAAGPRVPAVAVPERAWCMTLHLYPGGPRGLSDGTVCKVTEQSAVTFPGPDFRLRTRRMRMLARLALQPTLRSG